MYTKVSVIGHHKTDKDIGSKDSMCWMHCMKSWRHFSSDTKFYYLYVTWLRRMWITWVHEYWIMWQSGSQWGELGRQPLINTLVLNIKIMPQRIPHLENNSPFLNTLSVCVPDIVSTVLWGVALKRINLISLVWYSMDAHETKHDFPVKSLSKHTL